MFKLAPSISANPNPLGELSVWLANKSIACFAWGQASAGWRDSTFEVRRFQLPSSVFASMLGLKVAGGEHGDPDYS